MNFSNYKKWTTLIGGILIHLSLGSFYTFGNLTPYLTSYLREITGSNVRYSDTNWIYSTISISMALSSVLIGLFIAKYRPNIKLIIFIGCMVMSAGCALTFFTIKKSFFLTLLTYGIISGIGSGLSYLTPLEVAMKWFPNNKGNANSAILFGYGAGGIIFNQVQTLFINPNNYSPDKSYSSEFPDEKYFSKVHMDLLDRVPQSFLLSAGIYLVFQIIGSLLLFENKTIENVSVSLNVSTVNLEIEVKKKEFNSLGVEYNNTDAGLTIKDIIRMPSFYVITFMFFNFGHAANVVVNYYKTFGQTFILNDSFLSITGSVSSFFNASGRLLWGYLVDKLPFKVTYLILSTCLIVLVSTIYLTKLIAVKEVYLIWVCAVYFIQCGIYVVTPTAVAKSFGQKNFSSIYGLIFLICLPSSFVPTLLGELEESIGWAWLFVISSFFSLTGWISALFFNVKKGNGNDI